METPTEFHPDLTSGHLEALCGLLVNSRNETVASRNKEKDDWWGVACLAYGNARKRLAEQDEHKFLRYRQERGPAFTVMVGEVPIRVTSDGNEVPILPGERAAIEKLMRQERLWDDDRDLEGCILRLELEQPRWRDVERIVLRLIHEASSEEREAWEVYSALAAKTLTLPRKPADQVEAADFAFTALDDKADENEGDDAAEDVRDATDGDRAVGDG